MAGFPHLDAVAQGRLPTPEDTDEFFSAPLPYLVPAAVQRLALTAGAELPTAQGIGRRAGQLANAGLSVLLCFFLLRLGRLVERDTITVRITALVLLGSMATYYRMFANVRGEPLVAVFTVALTWLVLDTLLERNFSLRRGLAIGVVLGLLGLSRQWSIFPIAGLASAALLYLASHPRSVFPAARMAALAAVLAALVAGGFYLHLSREYGSVAVSNWSADALPFSLSNQPAEFYLDLAPEQLFGDPVYPSFPNRLVPIFYSTLWGDYWGYWVVAIRDLEENRLFQYLKVHQLIQRDDGLPVRIATNRARMGRHLARVNVVSLLPTALLFALGFRRFKSALADVIMH